MPTEEEMRDDSVAQLVLYDLTCQKNKVAAEIAQKKLELFELQGA